ncbi:hypothetical protein N7526_010114, partial [Penicillium atrosanguineum]
ILKVEYTENTLEISRQKAVSKSKNKTKTYNSRDSLVVTHPTTNLPACGLSTAERTGSPVLHTLWSYAFGSVADVIKATTVYLPFLFSHALFPPILSTMNLWYNSSEQLQYETNKLIFKKTKTYNSRDSLVVTHPTTNLPACGLSTAERTGSPVFHTLWSYVLLFHLNEIIYGSTSGKLVFSYTIT